MTATTHDDPIATILDLDRSRHDASPLARRRVARELASIARHRPTLAVSTAQRWLAEGGEHVDAIVLRGLRPLFEARDDTALRLAGYSPAAAIRVVDLHLDPSIEPAFGHALHWSVRLISADVRPTPSLLEVRVEHRDAAGELRRAARTTEAHTLGPLADTFVQRDARLPRRPSHRWASGPCRLVVAVNGRDRAAVDFTI